MPTRKKAAPKADPAPKVQARPKFARNTTIFLLEGEHAGRHVFEIGDELPVWAEEHVTNPACFYPGEAPEVPDQNTSILKDDLDDMTIPALADLAESMEIKLEDKDVADKEALVAKIREARG